MASNERLRPQHSGSSTVISPLSPQFLLSQSLRCLINSHSKYFSKTFFIDKNLWLRYYFMLKLQLPCLLPYVVDGAQHRVDSDSWIVQYNSNSMLSDERVSTCTTLSSGNFFLITTSTVFQSSIWLERELSDFTGINFLGLVDTRRLLLDYFEDKQQWQTHISNDKNYNNSFYDIFLAF